MINLNFLKGCSKNIYGLGYIFHQGAIKERWSYIFYVIILGKKVQTSMVLIMM